MCLLCEEEAFYQAYIAYMARKRAGETGEASAFRAEAVEAEHSDEAAVPVAKVALGDKAQSS